MANLATATKYHPADVAGIQDTKDEREGQKQIAPATVKNICGIDKELID